MSAEQGPDPAETPDYPHRTWTPVVIHTAPNRAMRRAMSRGGGYAPPPRNAPHRNREDAPKNGR